MARFLIAFDKFKNSLSAQHACQLAGESITRKHPQAEIDLCPLTDGGEGFGEILTDSVGGTWQIHQVTGPRGKSVEAGWGWVTPAKIPALVGKYFPAGQSLALLEMAAASGLAALPSAERDPWQTQTIGVGELLLAATAAGAGAILLGIGGSATNDLGLGALQALGLQALDGRNQSVPFSCPIHWPRIAAFSGGLPRALPPLFIACDVENPLLGEKGAAAIYGPQKGLRAADVEKLDAEARRIAGLMAEFFQKDSNLAETPGAGAAGGLAFGLLCAANARLLPGAELVFDWLDVVSRLQKADYVITGEGRFDASSLSGKGPGRLAELALQHGKKVHVFAGAVADDLPVPAGMQIKAITPQDYPLERALREAGVLLQKTVAETTLW